MEPNEIRQKIKERLAVYPEASKSVGEAENSLWDKTMSFIGGGIKKGASFIKGGVESFLEKSPVIQVPAYMQGGASLEQAMKRAWYSPPTPEQIQEKHTVYKRLVAEGKTPQEAKSLIRTNLSLLPSERERIASITLGFVSPSKVVEEDVGKIALSKSKGAIKKWLSKLVKATGGKAEEKIDELAGKLVPETDIKNVANKIYSFAEREGLNLSDDFLKAIGRTPRTLGKLPEKSAYQIIEESPGLKNLEISEAEKRDLAMKINKIKPELERIKGRPLTHEEVIEAAKESAVLSGATSRADTLQAEAIVLRTKQNLAKMASEKGVSKEFIDNLKALSSYATDVGRKLESLKTPAGAEEFNAVKEKVVKKLLDLGVKTEEIIEKSKNVDWNNANKVEKFYREFVKPSFSEVLDEFRYINTLSSPRTHIVNTFTNILQSVLAPTTRLVSGGFDYIGAALKGRDRKIYMKEVKPYVRGEIGSFGDAVKEALKALRGESRILRPDVARFASRSKILRPFVYVPRALEAMDRFFSTIIAGGEREALAYRALKQGKELTPELLDKISKEANEKANYWIFRQALHKEGQGAVLEAIDRVTDIAYALRRVPGGKWFALFVQTPMNILKQGLEFSPLGFTTVYKAANKEEQLAKAFIGSTVFAGAAALVARTDSTWAPPPPGKKRDLYYASGRKPYSIRIGDTWISYSKLGPLAYPIAMAAAIKYYMQQDPKRFTKSKLSKLGEILGGIGQFFSDQSYVQNLGALMDALEGSPEQLQSSLARIISNFASQIIPLSSLQRWVAQIIDPVYRKSGKDLSVKSIIQNIEKQTPFLSKRVEGYTGLFGRPSTRDYGIMGRLSPLELGKSRELPSFLYKTKLKESERKAIIDSIKQRLREKIESRLRLSK